MQFQALPVLLPDQRTIQQSAPPNVTIGSLFSDAKWANKLHERLGSSHVMPHKLIIFKKYLQKSVLSLFRDN